MTPPLNLIQFEHPEDRRFFIDLLAGGDEQKFEVEFLNCFDFRDLLPNRRPGPHKNSGSFSASSWPMHAHNIIH
jgi:hypothetical protein